MYTYITYALRYVYIANREEKEQKETGTGGNTEAFDIQLVDANIKLIDWNFFNPPSPSSLP